MCLPEYGGRASTADLREGFDKPLGRRRCTFWDSYNANSVISHEGSEITCKKPTLDDASHVGMMSTPALEGQEYKRRVERRLPSLGGSSNPKARESVNKLLKRVLNAYRIYLGPVKQVPAATFERERFKCSVRRWSRTPTNILLSKVQS